MCSFNPSSGFSLRSTTSGAGQLNMISFDPSSGFSLRSTTIRRQVYRNGHVSIPQVGSACDRPLSLPLSACLRVSFNPSSGFSLRSTQVEPICDSLVSIPQVGSASDRHRGARDVAPDLLFQSLKWVQPAIDLSRCCPNFGQFCSGFPIVFRILGAMLLSLP